MNQRKRKNDNPQNYNPAVSADRLGRIEDSVEFQLAKARRSSDIASRHTTFERSCVRKALKGEGWNKQVNNQ